MLKRIALPMLASASVFAAGCGDDPVQAEPFDLAGEWTYSATSLTGILPDNPQSFPGIQKIAVTCSVAPTPMVLSGSNDSFSGRFSSATMVCELLNEATFGARQVKVEVLGPVDGTVEQGQVSVDAVSYSFSPEMGSIAAWSNDGLVDGRSAAGTVVMQAIVGDEVVDLRGRWSASRN